MREGVEAKNLLSSRILLVGTFKVVEMNIQGREDYACRDNAHGSVLPVRAAKIFETQQRREHAIHSSQRAHVTITTVHSHDFVLLVLAYSSPMFFCAIDGVVS